ncbi:MAG: hypothetical protein OXG19_04145 [Chloroflexi bacterium]|nr:hypothetical protein [Chloroflexota bacterium]
MAITSAVQVFIPNTIGLIMLVALVVRAAGESDAYLSWATFTALAVSGAGMILHALRFRHLGSGRLIVSNFNIPFLAVCALAIEAGGPSLLASLIVASTLAQFVLTLRLAALRRVFTSTVSGVVVMLVAVSAVPYIISSTVVVPEGVSSTLFLAPGLVALIVGVAISLHGTPLWRMWVLPVTGAAGIVAAAPLGFYDIDAIIDAPWVSLPGFGWPGLDLSFDTDFWALLPVFVFVNLTAFMKAVGDLSVIHRASYRKPEATDYRAVQRGLNTYGLGTLLSGLLGTVPVAAPWAVTAVYIGFTGIAAKRVGIYLGLLTLAVAPFSKFLAVLIAIPGPVVSAVYIIIFGLLFVEGAKTVFGSLFTGQVDQKKSTITGISMVLGLSAGIFSGLTEGITSQLVGNTIVVGGLAAIGMTLLNELPSFRTKRLQVDLSETSLPAVDNFLSQFADSHSWTEKGKARLRLVGEEVLLSLLEEENDEQAEQKRRLVATIRPESSSAELEIVVASDDAIQGNIESRMMYLDEGQALEDDQGMSIRILRKYASSVHHRQYYGVDIITCRVMDE